MSTAFLAVAIVLGWFSSREVAQARFVHVPPAPAPDDWRAYSAWLKTHDSLASSVTQPAIAWVLVAGLGVAAVYCVSVLAHELGHYAAARAVKVDVAAVELNFVGGFIEMHDDARLTAGRLAAIVGAGPLVSAMIALTVAAALLVLGWPLTGTPDADSSAVLSAASILSFAFLINVVLLVVNLLPFRAFDGGQLLVAAGLRVRRQGW